MRAAALALISLVYVFYFFAFSLITPVIALFATTLGATVIEVGLIFALQGATTSILAVPSGIISDIFGRRFIIVLGIVFGMVALGMLSISASYLEVAVSLVLYGVSRAMVSPNLGALVADIAEPARPSRGFALTSICLQISSTLGPAAGGVMASFSGFRSTFEISFVLTGCALLVVVAFLGGVSRAHPTTAGKTDDDTGVKTRLTTTLSSTKLQVALLTILTSSFLGQSIQSFLPLYASSQGIGVGEVGLLFSVQALFSAISRLPASRLSDTGNWNVWLGPTGTMAAAIAIGAITLAHGSGALAIVMVAFGASSGTANLTSLALAAKAATPKTRGLAMGVFEGVRYLGLPIAGLLTAFLIAGIGYSGGWLGTGLAASIFSVAIFALARFSISKSAED